MRKRTIRFREVGPVLFVGLAITLGLGAATHNIVLAGGAVFLVVLGWIVANWRFGIPLLIVVSCTDGFIKYYYEASWTFVLKDLVLASILLGIASTIAREPKAIPRGPWLAARFVMFYIAFDAAAITFSNDGSLTALAGFRQHALYAVLFFVGALYFDSMSRLARLALIGVAAVTFAASVGVLQHILGPTWLSLGRGFILASNHYVAGLGTAEPAYRAYGTMVDPAALGLACAMAVIYAFAMLSTARAWPARLLLGIAILTCGAALYFTGTRAAILGLVVGLAVLVCSLAARPDSRRFIALAATVALSLVVIAAPFAIGLIHAETEDRFQAESASSALADRQRSIDGVIRTFGERPFGFGLGVTGAGGRLAPEYRWFSIDNVYFTALYETGTIGLLALLAAHGSLLFLTLRFAYRAKSRQLGIAYGSFAAAHVSLLVAGWFDQGAFDYAPLAQMFWLFAGSIALPARLEEASPDAVQSQKRLVPSRSAILRPLGDPRRIQLVTRMRSPGAAALAVKPLTEADIEAAVARFNARLRERLLELAQAGHWSQYSADELFGRAGRELFIDMKKELARLETDPFSSDAARAVIGSAVEIASLMMMLADKFSTEPPSGAQ